MTHEESALQKACVTWFRLQYPDHALMLFAVPNGGGRSRIESAIMKGEGVTAGVADLILLEARGRWGSLCIEMKTRNKSSRQSPSQKVWQEAAEKAGNRYVVIRSFDAFRALVTEYMGLPAKGRVTITAEDIAPALAAKEKDDGWRDVLKEKPKPGTRCRVQLHYDTYEAVWDGHDWIDITGWPLRGVIAWKA